MPISHRLFYYNKYLDERKKTAPSPPNNVNGIPNTASGPPKRIFTPVPRTAFPK